MINTSFKLIKKEFFRDIYSEVYEYEHIKTKAKLIHIKNDDVDKVFSIGFKTIPYNNTGVAHIIEHSVLCGSERFPIKKPFVELNKSSLNTFLNAFTTPDKTLYPVSSQNNKDFMNLISVYLDAVFAPNLIKNKEIFMQEGWHYKLESKDDKLSIDGVVYNEMKGALSSINRIMSVMINRSLYSNNYKYISGGDPDDIPNLTYESLLEFYYKFYHPTNSFICLYGNCDIDSILNFIDINYLSKYEYKYIDSSVKYAEPFLKENKLTYSYSLNENDNSQNKTFFSKNYIISTINDDDTCLAMEILLYILVNSDTSIIKKRLLENNLCGNVKAYYYNVYLQPKFTILVKNTDENNIEKINNIINDSIKELSIKGIDKNILEACITTTEFKIMQKISNNSSKGMDLCVSLYDKWSFSDNPVDIFHYRKRIDKLYFMMENNVFERLLKKYFIRNTHTSTVILNPQKGLAKQKDKDLDIKLQSYKEGLCEDEINTIINDYKNLKLRQSTPDSEDKLSLIPSIGINDINKNIIKRYVVEEKLNRYTLLHYNKFTNDILYTQLLFDTSNLTTNEICYAGLIAKILGKISTKNYCLDELTNRQMINTGELSFVNSAFLDVIDTNTAYKKFKITLSVSTDKFKSAIELINEILFNSNFDCHTRIKQIIGMNITSMQSEFIRAGHVHALKRLLSKFDSSFYYLEKSSGYTFYEFLRNLNNNFDIMKDEITENLRNVLNKILNINNFIVNITGTEKQKKLLKANITIITEKLNNTKQSSISDNFKYDNKTEAFTIASNVQYVAMGYNYKKLGYRFDGSLKVVGTILKADYLWNNIRVMGGAYGTMMKLDESGQLFFVTYRDPNLDKTIDRYKQIPKYISDIIVNKNHLTKYIIGTIGDLDQPLSIEEEGEVEFIKYISHNTNENQQRIRSQILNTSLKDVNNAYELLKAVIDENVYNVFGNNEIIHNSKLPFDTIINI